MPAIIVNVTKYGKNGERMPRKLRRKHVTLNGRLAAFERDHEKLNARYPGSYHRPGSMK